VLNIATHWSKLCNRVGSSDKSLLQVILLICLSYSATPECIEAFVGSLSPLVSRLLYLQSVELDSQSIQAVGKRLKYLCIDKLTVTLSDISEDGMSCLGDGLQNTKPLQLTLAHNHIDSNGLTPLAEKRNTADLVSLSLSHHAIGHDGAIAFASGLKGVIRLGRLDLSHITTLVLMVSSLFLTE